MSFSLGHTLVTPLPDGRVSYAPCRHCGDPCQGHSMTGRLEVPSAASQCRTCGAECAPAQCDTCRADGVALARDEERAAVVRFLRRADDECRVSAIREPAGSDGRRRWLSLGIAAKHFASAIERGDHRS